MSIFSYEEGALSANYDYLNELGEEGHIRVALYAKKGSDKSSTKDHPRQRAMFAIKEFPITRFHREYLWTPTQL
jgi:hypothetical protein